MVKQQKKKKNRNRMAAESFYADDGIQWEGAPKIDEMENNFLKKLLFRYRVLTVSYTFTPREIIAADIFAVTLLLLLLYFFARLIL